MQNRFHRINPPEDGKEPPDVRFEEVRVEPWPDQIRVKVHLQVTPFLKPPNLEMVIKSEDGLEVARTSIVENIDFSLVFTMHVRGREKPSSYQLDASLFYDDLGVVDSRQVFFNLDQPQNGLATGTER